MLATKHLIRCLPIQLYDVFLHTQELQLQLQAAVIYC